MRVEVLVTECTVREAIESPGDMGYMPRMRRSQLINGNELGWSRTHSINDSVRKVMFGFMIVYAVSVIYFLVTLYKPGVLKSIHRNTFSAQERKYLSRVTQCELQFSLVTRVLAVADAVDVFKPFSYDVSNLEAKGEGAHWHLDESGLLGAVENAPPTPSTKDVPRYWTCELRLPIL